MSSFKMVLVIVMLLLVVIRKAMIMIIKMKIMTRIPIAVVKTN